MSGMDSYLVYRSVWPGGSSVLRYALPMCNAAQRLTEDKAAPRVRRAEEVLACGATQGCAGKHQHEAECDRDDNPDRLRLGEQIRELLDRGVRCSIDNVELHAWPNSAVRAGVDRSRNSA